MANKIFTILFFLIFIIALVHTISLNFYLYWQFWWLDIVMHFLAGFWLASFVFWLVYFSGFWKNPPKGASLSIFSALLITVLAAITWEIFELKLGITFTALGNYWTDTFSDIFTSLAGALTASIFFRRLLNVYAKF